MRNTIASTATGRTREPAALRRVFERETSSASAVTPLATFATSLVLGAALSLAAAQDAAAAIRSFTISPQLVSTALKQFAAQSDLQLIYTEHDVGIAKTEGVKGDLVPRDALERILEGTDLEYEITANNVVVVRRPGAPAATSSRGIEGGSFRMAQAGSGAGVSGSEATGPASADLEEVVVTATRRAERLTEVAGSVSALTGKQLQQMGAQSMADYVTKLPSVHFNDYVPGRSEIVIRGVSTTTFHDQGQTVVGYYINDAPMTEAGFPVVIPDVDAFDLDRVEVLRGPQGSLFGSASLGGLINYIVKEADPTRIDGAVELGMSTTRNADGDVNHAVKAMFNAPIVNDVLGVRVVGYERSDAGFIDNALLDDRGVNDTRTRGMRGSLVATPGENTRLSLMMMYQKLEVDNQSYLRLGTEYDKFVSQEEPQSNEFRLTSARLEQDLGFADLTVLGSYAEKEGSVLYDYTAYGFFGGTLTDYTVTGRSHAYHVEARLASSGDRRVKWLIGANYSESKRRLFEYIRQDGLTAWVDANPGLVGGTPGSVLAPGDVAYQYDGNQRNEDLGVFGELSYAILPTLEVTVGGRQYDTKSESTIERPDDLFSFFEGGTGYSYLADQSGSGFSPQASIAYRPTSDLTAYLKYAKGFRVGGPNPNPPGVTGLAYSYDSDTVDNYEIGLHASLPQRRLAMSAAAFRIDWDDIQVRQFTPAGFSYVTNAGAARIDGVEFQASWRIVPAFELSSSATYQDARITEFLPYLYATNGLGGYPAGSRLPGSSKWALANTASLSIQGAPLNPRLELSHRYLSEAPVSFQSVNTRGDYHLFDLRLLADVTDDISVMAFVNNLFDEYGVLSAPFAEGDPNPQGTVLRPRTVGLRLNWSL